MHKYGRSFLLLLILALVFAGCERPTVNFKKGDVIVLSDGETYLTEPEILLITLQCKTEFESYYREFLGEDFWNTELRDGMRFDEYVREYHIYEEGKALLVLSDMAEEDGIRLYTAEEEKLYAAAEDYITRLGEKERAYTKAGTEDVFRLLKKYVLAGREIEKLKKGTIDVSFEESRVADIQLIEVFDRNLADSIKKRLTDGENFLSLAATYSEDKNVAYSVAKGDLKPELDRAVFEMREGDISNVIKCDNAFYIIRLSNSYNTLLSGNYKRNLLAARTYTSWKEPYEQALKQKTIKRDNAFFAGLPLNTEEELNGNDLYACLDALE